jgi:hypothetical protein
MVTTTETRVVLRRSSDIVLVGVGLALGLAMALGHAAYRAVSADADAGRWGAFGDAMLFPGSLIVIAVAATVWLGWKANLDDNIDD